ncbi:MAG: XkdN-like protein [Candidatus Pristimantibacillus lignocellulolyticus]|uniref:XkdN-like protein n=1 Tax=Candidatus Pristimantibacillus lignocellulolyticus TaxID=2994561 RepID=A0A9J6ZFI3_9BACL|nr:MAG: XkdN-like protein [Candidatus Pristimantibacillus lignocellulolyticus]
MSLQDFLNANPVDNLVEEVTISPRFKDKKGNLMPFKIKAMTNKEFDEIRKACTMVKKGRKVEFDAQKFNIKMVINHTITPDFKHADSIKKLGCATADDYVQRVLLSGEVTTLAAKIQELSGFDVDMEELVEESKN